MTAIEVLALIVIVLSALKLLVLWVSPRAWYTKNPLVKIFYHSMLGPVIALILAAVVLNYLLAELSIIQILAVTLFVWLLLIISLAPYMKQMYGMVMKDLDSGAGILKKNWLAVILWLALIIWAAYELSQTIGG